MSHAAFGILESELQCPRFLLATLLVANRFRALRWLVGRSAAISTVISAVAPAEVPVGISVGVSAAVSVGVSVGALVVALAVPLKASLAFVGAFET